MIVRGVRMEHRHNQVVVSPVEGTGVAQEKFVDVLLIDQFLQAVRRQMPVVASNGARFHAPSLSLSP
jgi:hypothetical protein